MNRIIPIQHALDRYHLCRSQRDVQMQLAIADQLVEQDIPELIERLAAVTMERNSAQQRVIIEGALVD